MVRVAATALLASCGAAAKDDGQQAGGLPPDLAKAVIG
jgi:hypothetical protein